MHSAMVSPMVISMAEQITLYRHVQPVAPPIPKDSEAFGVEYRTFYVVRDDLNYMLWSIKTADNGKPPLRLRSSFTNKQKAMVEIDSFLAEEAQKQNETANDYRD
jgi:hypothetical protein